MKTKLEFLYVNGKHFVVKPQYFGITAHSVVYTYTGPSNSKVTVEVPVKELVAVRATSMNGYKHIHKEITVFKNKCLAKLNKAGAGF